VLSVLCTGDVDLADKYNTPDESPNYFVVTDGDIRAMLKDHLSVNNTVSVTWDSAGKAVVRGSKTEGEAVLCLIVRRDEVVV
jgi:hypothetical protein